jgi:hypothetical protein
MTNPTDKIVKITEYIKQEIESERYCMKHDDYDIQELEHINQIEMANKILKFIRGLK